MNAASWDAAPSDGLLSWGFNYAARRAARSGGASSSGGQDTRREEERKRHPWRRQAASRSHSRDRAQNGAQARRNLNIRSRSRSGDRPRARAPLLRSRSRSRDRARGRDPVQKRPPPASAHRQHSPPSRRQPDAHRRLPGAAQERPRTMAQPPWAKDRSSDNSRHSQRLHPRSSKHIASSEEECPEPEPRVHEEATPFGYKDPRGVAWCQSGNGRRMLFVDGESVSEELLSIAKSSCGSLAYWAKDLERTGNELLVSADGGWPAELVPSGHCDEVRLSEEAGDLQGLTAAAIGLNKKQRSKALALAVLLSAVKEVRISDEALQNCHPGLLDLVNASEQAFDALDEPPDNEAI